jgi:6-phosphogluconolactonase/glucosamine-6-phosphate isomerase/deaminase
LGLAALAKIHVAVNLGEASLGTGTSSRRTYIDLIENDANLEKVYMSNMDEVELDRDCHNSGKDVRIRRG